MIHFFITNYTETVGFGEVDRLQLEKGADAAIESALDQLRAHGVGEETITRESLAELIIGESLTGTTEQGPWKITRDDSASFAIETPEEPYH